MGVTWIIAYEIGEYGIAKHITEAVSRRSTIAYEKPTSKLLGCEKETGISGDPNIHEAKTDHQVWVADC